MIDKKQCTCCGEWLDFSCFSFGRKRKDGTSALRARCKKCQVADHLDTYHNKGGKEKQKKRSFKNNLTKYGLTPEMYEQLLKDQKNSCAICGAESALRGGKKYNLFVDHCHSTGKVRGLLCHTCNAGLGYFRDSEDLLLQARKYLNDSRN